MNTIVVPSHSAGDDSARKFRVDASTGVLEATSITLDREATDFYVLAVAVSDSGTPARTVRNL